MHSANALACWAQRSSGEAWGQQHTSLGLQVLGLLVQPRCPRPWAPPPHDRIDSTVGQGASSTQSSTWSGVQ